MMPGTAITRLREATQAGAPWPLFRHDSRNSGHSPLHGGYQGDRPWSYQTGKGIFSTPVIDAEGNVYVGSADHVFYALRQDGSVRWRFRTGEIIDSAAALPAVAEGQPARVLVPSGDGRLYALRCDTGDALWAFDARTASRAGYNNWWEANVALAPDGTIYAGNTNFSYYALNTDGTLRWTYETGANAWSAGAVAGDGTIVWGSNDTFVHAVRPDGTRKWRRRTLGFIAASAALGSDGTVYIGSFDSRLYALDPETGRVRWTVKTQDHVYSSAALLPGKAGETESILFGSTDGNLYAVTPAGGLLWRYETGAPIRSSPVLGRKPEGEPGWIAYVGCGNGKLYAIDAETGRRRWSYDTTPDAPVLRDRNDLNGSPALGKTGVVIGGEHGQLWYVPYDYPLHHADARGCTDPGDDVPRGAPALTYITPGGNRREELREALPASTILTFRLSGRTGKSADLRLYNRPFLKPGDALRVTIDPPVEVDVATSADGRHLYILPRDFLQAGQPYSIRVAGNTYAGGLHIGNLTIGGRKSGAFSQEITIRTRRTEAPRMPLHAGEESVTALEITRFAVPIPTMLPSLNQIGFDYMDWIAGVVDISDPDDAGEGRLILWAIGGRRDADGVLVADPATDFVLPLSGRYRHDLFAIHNRGLRMRITGIPIPFNHFELRGQLGPDLRVGETATAFADTKALAIPTFGPLLVLAGLANNWWQKLLAMATFVTHPYADGPANRRPEGVTVRALAHVRPTRRREGHVTAQIDVAPSATYPLDEHLPAIVLIDDARGEAVPLDYQANLAATADGDGNVQSVTLTLPASTAVPTQITAIVMVDVFPLYRERLW